VTELRNHDRIFLDRAIAVQLSDGHLVRARLVNLSSGGLGVLYPAPAEVGSVLGLHFQLPDEQDQPVMIHCQGTVRHCYVQKTNYLSGFEFSQISAEDRKLIQQFINRKRATLAQRMLVK
jgi:c-di-GMP-binding flagellar brake protein YcgR